MVGTDDGKATWQILMMHHHPYKYSYPTVSEDISAVEEGSELLDIIASSGIDVVCHGHRHQAAMFTRVNNGWSSPKTFVCAGSVAVGANHRRAGEFPNMCHILTLESREETTRAAVGTLESFAYNSRDGWRPHEYSPLVQIDGRQHFGSVATVSNVRDALKVIVRDTMSTVGDEIAELPDFAVLPLSLRCLPNSDLNDLLKDVIDAEEKGAVLIGQFPEMTAIRRAVR